MRAWDHLRHRQDDFDIVQDNQCLGYGLLLIERQLGLPVLGTIHHPITVDRRLEMEAAESWYKRLTLRRWYAFVDMQTQVARRLERIITVSENSFKDIVHDHKVDPARMAVVPVGVDIELFKPLPEVAVVPGRLVTTASADVAMKGLKFLLEAVAKLRTERDDVHLVVIGKRKPGGASDATIKRLGPRGARRVRHGRGGAADHRALLRGRDGRRAVALRGLLAPGHRGDGLRHARSWAPPAARFPRSSARTATPPWWSRPATARRSPPRSAGALEQDDLRGTIGARGRQRIVDRWSWKHTAREDRRAVPHPAGTGLSMLTVRFDELGVQPGDLLLDMGCGAGRHAFESFRLGAKVVAFDYSAAELKDVGGLFAAMREAGEAGTEPGRDGRHHQRRRAPPPVPGRHLRPHHRLRGAGARLRRPGGPRRDLPGAQAGRHARRHGAVLAARADLLGAVRGVPRALRGGRPRAHLLRAHAAGPHAHGRPGAGRRAPRPRPALARTGGSSARSAPPTTTTRS